MDFLFLMIFDFFIITLLLKWRTLHFLFLKIKVVLILSVISLIIFIPNLICSFIKTHNWYSFAVCAFLCVFILLLILAALRLLIYVWHEKPCEYEDLCLNPSCFTINNYILFSIITINEVYYFVPGIVLSNGNSDVHFYVKDNIGFFRKDTSSDYLTEHYIAMLCALLLPIFCIFHNLVCSFLSFLCLSVLLFHVYRKISLHEGRAINKVSVIILFLVFLLPLFFKILQQLR